MIKALFFDLHEVVTKGCFEDIYKEFSNISGVPLFKVVNFHDENLSGLLTGAVNSVDMCKAFNLTSKLSVEEMIDLWKQATLNNLKVDADIVRLLESLKNNYSLAALTNVTEQRYYADISMGLYDYFDHLVLSFKVGVKKPDPDYFEKALEISQVKPEEVIFIDDQSKNIATASLLGMNAIQFTDYETLIKELGKFGIKV